MIAAVLSLPVKASDIISCVESQYSRSDRSDSDLDDPSLPGEYSFRQLQYGQQPSWFSLSKPDLVTPQVGLPLFLGNYSKSKKYSDDAFHDFDSSEVALDAKVWAPLGDGPFPLVLLVHGNSNPGFDYLGELLASQGHIVVQIDQTYLNGLWGENGARGWVILEHLSLWRKWNQTSSHLFHQRVDMQKIALIGMSRGGEAVALAANFNRWKHNPDNGEKLNFNFSIRSVVALAPMDGQYLHQDGPNRLRHVDYLVLQGGHDADVYQFLGSRQWHRTQVTESHVKHSVYLYRGNHINFNQSMSGGFHWGQRGDFDENLLTPAEQQHVTKVFVSAFLRASLFGNKEYRELLQRPKSGEFGLTDDIYVSRFASSDLRYLTDFEREPHNTRQLKEGPEGLSSLVPLNIEHERLRFGLETDNRVLAIELEKNRRVEVRIPVPQKKVLNLAKKGRFNFQFSMARADAGSSATCARYNLLADSRLNIIVDGRSVYTGSLASTGTLSPLLLSDFSALESDSFQFAKTEAVLQSFSLPVALSASILETITRGNIVEFALEFSTKRDMKVLIDDIGLTP